MGTSVKSFFEHFFDFFSKQKSQKCEQFSYGPFVWDLFGFGVLKIQNIRFKTESLYTSNQKVFGGKWYLYGNAILEIIFSKSWFGDVKHLKRYEWSSKSVWGALGGLTNVFGNLKLDYWNVKI